MLLEIPQVLSPAQVAQCRQALSQADWANGKETAGHLSVAVKHNRQLRETHPTAQLLGRMIVDALERHPVFMSGSLPAKIVPPLFNCYTQDEHYGPHVDGGIRPVAGTSHRVRTDLAATLFLSSPDEYDGGDLIIEDTFGTRTVKLPAGDLVLYPASSVHQVTPVRRGARFASFFWIQSMVRQAQRRRMLYDLDRNIQLLRRESPQSTAIVELTALYHNLLREWSDV